MPATPTSTLPLAHAHERKNGQEPGYAKWFTPVSLFNVSLRPERFDEAAYSGTSPVHFLKPVSYSLRNLSYGAKSSAV